MGSFTGLLNNAALMLILCVIYDTFGIYAISKKNLRDYITGLLVGLIGIAVMLNPWSLQPGVFFDTRWVLLSLCGLFFGLIPTAVAVIIAGSFRLYQGGPGGIVGTVVIVATACVGLAWRYWKEKHDQPLDWKRLYAFGVLVQLTMLSCMFLMPADMRIPIIKAVAPPILLIYPVLTLMIGLILKRQEDRRCAEKELVENRKALSRERGLLRGVVNSIPDLIFFKNTEGAYLGCNKSFESFIGAEEQSLLGKTDSDLFDAETADFLLRNDDEIFTTEKPVAKEEWVDAPDGGKVLLDTVKTPFKGLDGTLHGLVGISRDATERRQAEKNLSTEKERLAVTLRCIGDGVITTDISGNVVLLNKVAENLTGWSHEEAVGRPLEEVFQIVNELTGETCENPVTNVLGSGRIVGLADHTKLIAKKGKERNIADSGAPIFDAESIIIGVVLVFRDVTRQVKTEKELLKIKKLKSIGVLAGGIAHDFNNILAAILGNINLALLDKGMSYGTKELLSSAEKASIRAKGLTQQLLTFAKGGEPVKETSSLQRVIEDSANFVLHGDKVACRYDIPEDLWLVDIDKGQVSQVIQNIVLNAGHSMPEGGIVMVSCENVSLGAHSNIPALQKGRFVKISIQDDGVGMPANVVEKIFDPYFSTKQEGSGLGLAISQSIINKHHGNILVESSPGAGSNFTIYLPASEGAETRQQQSAAEKKVLSQANILVMDDEEIVRTVAHGMLTQLGHEVVLATDGGEAVKLYRESLDSGRPFDLIIMDLTIPGGMNGKEAVQQVLNIDRSAKVIVSSGYSNDPILANYKEYGFRAAIAKPYVLQELSRVLYQVIG